jgi:DNA polymerase I-like protein with 3'-5' exonuclease and polymerase domains
MEINCPGTTNLGAIMNDILEVNYKSTKVPYIALQWLDALPDTIALDFEGALKFTPAELLAFKAELDLIADDPSQRNRQIELNANLKASALSHPSYVLPTHLSIAWTETDSIVIILDTPKMRSLVMHWLTTTTRKQVWHNASFDFKLISYATNGQLPLDFEDTALFTKCLLNHVEIQKAGVRLKDLAGHKYGAWAVSADNFDLSQIYNEDLIKYAATDACATFYLWQQLQNHRASTP